MAPGDEGIQRELSRGTTELAVLALIDARKRYGYDLLSSLGSASDGSIAIKEGTLYPVLHRLEDAGYIAASWEAEGRSAPRKYYSITKEGKARLGALRTEWQRLSAGMERLLNGGAES
ncbi:MAG: PadR family transcriptional regulator, regulatory protein PadR [Actinomycetota bacterium]|nr:PadR family transcriptional regulator, regulatory protein PadR [Actinomycetota bacterium]